MGALRKAVIFEGFAGSGSDDGVGPPARRGCCVRCLSSVAASKGEFIDGGFDGGIAPRWCWDVPVEARAGHDWFSPWRWDDACGLRHV